MEQFNSLTAAAKLAVTRCKSWQFSASGTKYDTPRLLELAAISDSECPLKNNGFYLVDQAGAIGLCVNDKNIDWMFLNA